MCLLVNKSLKMKEPSRICYKVLINTGGELKSPILQQYSWKPGVNRPKTKTLPAIKSGTVLGKSCLHVYWNRHHANRGMSWVSGNTVVVPVRCLRRHLIARETGHAAFAQVRLLKRDYTAALSKKT